jgi:dipeptidase D
MLTRMRFRAYAFRSFTSAILMASSTCCLSPSSSSYSSTLASAVPNVFIPPENLEAIDKLEPKSLWYQFAIISSIPRPSKKEEAVIRYIKEFAEKRNLKWKQDAVGNLAVFHPGCGTGQEAPPVILQGHIDMVTEKNSGTSHDFETDPILLRRFQRGAGEDWLGAQATTLGADNGIGVAATLALLEIPVTEETPLPPLEALFTVDEETGLTGAMELDVKALGLAGKTMLNLDTEEWGELYVGCAGGGESTMKLPLERGESSSSAGTDQSLVELKVDGLLGGHSGINIHEGRANAVLLCAEATQAALQQEGVQLVSITGGDKHNAIPREARAHLLLSNEKARDAVEQVLQKCQAAAVAEYGTLEKNLGMALVDSINDGSQSDTSSCPRPLEKASAAKLISLLLALPHGPIKFSHAMPDLVETSNNVASLSMSSDDDTATILCSTRSSIGSALESTRNKLSALALLAGASIEKLPSYPGWNPNMYSEALRLGCRLLSERLGNGQRPGVKAIHAGLECGLLIEKMGGDVDALSFGPTITGAHSPDESIRIDTVPPFYELVQDILAELAKKRA